MATAPIIKIKRSTTGGVPALSSGELAMDLLNSNLYVGNASNTAVAIGGSGTFARKDASDVAFTGGSINGATIGATTASSGAFTTLTVTGVPAAETDVVRLKELTAAVTALGSVFRYAGNTSAISGTSAAYDLNSLTDKNTGAYYSVHAAGTYVDAAFSAKAKVGDAFVKITGSWQKLDNVDVAVAGSSEIDVTGNEDIGYTVTLLGTAGTFKKKTEDKTQNIVLPDTIAGTTAVTGIILGVNAAVGGAMASIENFVIDGGTY
jgi:hypothetical protein